MSEQKQLQVPVTWFVGAVGLGLLVVAIAYFVGKGCAPSPQPVDDLGIDAGPGEAEIAARLDGALQAGEAELRRIDEEHAADIASFEDRQREKYEEVREQGPEALADWFSDFNRRLRDGGPR